MRNCPVCNYQDAVDPSYRYNRVSRTKVFSMTYQIPDGWPLPSCINWYTCDRCGMIYGDGDFDQAMLNEFYTKYYGYGVSNPDNIERLKRDATDIAYQCGLLLQKKAGIVVDFGGAGDDGRSVLVEQMRRIGYSDSFSIGPDELLPKNCAVIYASHVLEHIYDLPETMQRLMDALAPDGLLIVDVPDATGLLRRWKMPILDFNTKHINHFTVRTLLELGHKYGLEAVQVKPYELEYAPCVQVHFRRLDVAQASAEHIQKSIVEKVAKLRAATNLEPERQPPGSRRVRFPIPVNVWGLGDVTWHILSEVNINVLDYIDSDPAFEGQTFKGKPVLKRPTNDAPIVIMAQGQRTRLIKYIRDMGIQNEIIEI